MDFKFTKVKHLLGLLFLCFELSGQTKRADNNSQYFKESLGSTKLLAQTGQYNLNYLSINNHEERRCFVQNMGQFIKTKEIEGKNVRYVYNDEDGIKVYFTDRGVLYRTAQLENVSEWEFEKATKKDEAFESEEEEREKIKRRERKLLKTSWTEMNWEGSSPNMKLIAEDEKSFYFNYYMPIIDKDKVIGNVKGFGKILYKNIYPNIDIEYTIHPKEGIKYTYLVHPGADISSIKMKYSGADIQKAKNGNIVISAEHGFITESAPSSFFGNTENGRPIDSEFRITDKNVVGFMIAGGNQIITEELTIDPWQAGTPFPISAYTANDVTVDGSGNAITYSYKPDPNPGPNSLSGQRIDKYSSTGVFQWTFDLSTGASYKNNFQGDVKADPSGNIYVCIGLGRTVTTLYNTIKLNSTGTALIWGTTTGTVSANNMYEEWTIAFNCDYSKFYQSGGGLRIGSTTYYNVGVEEPVNAATGVEGALLENDTIGEIYDTYYAPNSLIYHLAADSNSGATRTGAASSGAYNTLTCINPLTNARLFRVKTGYSYIDGDFKAPGSVGMCGIVSSCNYLYTTNGSKLDRWNLTTGVHYNQVTITGGNATAGSVNSGLLADKCGNIYVGSNNAIYVYDATLNLINTISVPGRVFDLAWGSNSDIIACGGTTTPSTFLVSVSYSACTLPNMVTVTATQPTCTTPTGSATANATFCGAPYTFLWSDGQTTQTATGLAAGTYTVTVSSTVSCPYSYVQTQTVTINPASGSSSVTVPSNTIICSGNTVNSSVFTSTPAGASFAWSNSNTATGLVSSGTGSVPSFTATNNGSTAITSVITVTPTLSGCSGTPSSYTITVNPIPAITSANTATVCSGAALNIPLTSNIASSYSWIAGANANVGGESITAQSTSTINNTLTNTTASSQTVTYTVTPTSTAGSCPGTPQTVTVTVNPLPVMTSTTSASICSGTALNIALTSNTSSTYSWIAGANANVGGESTTSQSTSTINNTLSNTTSAAETVVYTVTPTSNPAGCVGTPQTVTVTVNPLPTMTSANTATVCSGVAVSIPLTSNIASNYSWIAGDNTSTTGESLTSQTTTTINNTITNSSASVQSVVYTITPTSTSGTCPGTAQTITVTVNPLPVMTSTTSASICSGSALNIALTSNVSSSYSWVAGANANVGGESTTAQSTSNINNTLTNTTAGSQTVTYTVTPTSTAGNCTGTPQTVSVTVNPLPNANAGSNQTLTCGSPTVTLTGSSTSSPVSYSWTGPGITAGANSATASANASGTYTLTVTNTLTGCSSTSTVLVSASAGVPNISMASSPTITCTNSVVTISGSSTTSGVNYQWSAGVNSPTSASTTVNTPGTYTLTVTDPGNGCTNSGTIVVATSTVLPNVNAGTNQTITCSTQTVTLTGSSSTSGITYSWSPGGTTPTSASTNVTASGTYTLTVTNPANGCVNSANVTVNTNTTTPNISTSPTQTLTCSVSSVTLSGSSTTSGVAYLWNPGGSTPNGSSTNVSASGSYVLTVTDPSNGCSSQSTVSVVPNMVLPNVNAGTSQMITCSTQTVTLSGSSTTSGVSYQWNPGGSSPTSASTNVTASGNYTLTATDPNNGCTSTSTVNVSINNTIPNISVGNSQTLTCSNQTVTISGSSTTPGVNYLWAPGGSNSNQSSTNVSVPGTYTLTVTDPNNGCSAQGSVLVSSTNAIPNISMGSNQTLTCNSTTATINASSSTAGVTYLWSPGGTTPNSSSTIVSAAGTYTLTVTDTSSGCSATSSVLVNDDFSLPNVSAGNDQNLTCTVTSLSLIGSSSTIGAIFNWSGPGILSGANNDTAIVDMVGEYILTITNQSNGCSATDTVNIIPDANLPNVNAGNDQFISCLVGNVNLSGSSTNANASFQWTGPNGFSATGTSANATLPGTYTLTVTDAVNNCSNSDVIIINDSTQAPSANAGSDVTLTCSNNTASLNASSGVNGVSFSWSGPGGFSSASQNISVSTPGNYTLTVTNVNTGCSSSDNVDVLSGVGIPDANPGTAQVINCINTAATLNGSSNTSGATFNWSGPNGFGSSQASPSVTDSGTYILTVTDPSNGCTATASVVVTTNNTLPSISATSSSPLINCIITNIALIGSSTTPGTTLTWSDANGVISNPASISSAATYSLTVYDPSNGCTATTTITIGMDTISPDLTLSGGDTINCVNPGTSIIAGSSVAGASYSWSGPNGFSASQQTTGVITDAGSYSITVTNPSNGCSTSSVQNIIQGPNPLVSFTANPTSGVVPLPVNFTNTSDPAFSSYLWSFGDGNSSAALNSSNTYTLTGTFTVQLVGITPNNSCNDTTTVTITVYPESEILIPNIFSPNGDGTNEFFYITSSGLKELHVDIYDRWGLKVGEINGLNGYWDGTNASEGTYFFILNATGYDGSDIQKQGYLMLVK